MSTLGMMLPILLLLLPLVAFADDGPTIQGQRSAKLLKIVTKEMCQHSDPCSSGKWCCDECCESSRCRCTTNHEDIMKSTKCAC
uniref:Conopeptide n=1 Tax=Conus lenavati TaxID=1519839 RepID=A0A0K8TUU2_CONLV